DGIRDATVTGVQTCALPILSNARDDLPEPETPVTTVSWLCGISKSMFLRLWTRAPRTVIESFDIAPGSPAVAHRRGSAGRDCPRSEERRVGKEGSEQRAKK